MSVSSIVKIVACQVITWLALASSATMASSHVPLNTLSFDEIPFQPVDGLSYAGVLFDFKIAGVDSTEAFYNSFGPGTLTYVSDPSLTGDSAGVLTLDFALPTSMLEFGLALNTAEPLMPGLNVELFAPDTSSLGTTAVDVLPTSGDLGFAENRFTYSGPLVVRATIDFQHEPGSFALDNLTYVIIPEPSTAQLGVVWLMILSAFKLPRQGLRPRPGRELIS